MKGCAMNRVNSVFNRFLVCSKPRRLANCSHTVQSTDTKAYWLVMPLNAS
jgi:hypothetical protein